MDLPPTHASPAQVRASITGLIDEMRRILGWLNDLAHFAGDASALYQASQQWQAVADEIRALENDLTRTVFRDLSSGPNGNWNDPAGQAFQQYWNGLAIDIQDLTPQFDQMARALHDAGDEVQNFYNTLESIAVEMGIWISVTAAAALIPGADIAEGIAAVVRGSALLEEFWTAVQAFILFLNAMRAAFPLNLLVLYGSRLLERGLLLGDPTKGWSQFDSSQLLSQALIGSAVGAAFSLPARLARMQPLLQLQEDLANGLNLPGYPAGPLANTLKAAGFANPTVIPTMEELSNALGWFSGTPPASVPAWLQDGLSLTRIPLFARLTQGVTGSSNLVLSRLPAVFDQTVSRALNSLVTANAYNLFNHAFLQRDLGGVQRALEIVGGGSRATSLGIAGTVALNGLLYLTLGKAIPQLGSTAATVGVNTALDLTSPQVRDFRGLVYVTRMDEVGAIRNPNERVGGKVPVGSLPRYRVVPGDTLWDLSTRQYGNPYDYGLIARANRIVNPRLIYPDQTIVLPAVPLPPAA
ncbi:MAG TPA: LysM peptidoglycan-binding domain-containing protein [Candidatus Dormibacteraeota bacterium]|nr:LysM peptidoglycan-binding domain-containing protein [Candidatus Dormibacteraeota bacterium]